MSSYRLTIALSLLLSILFPVGISGADTDIGTTKDGWSVNPLPALGYDSDFGFMAGGFIDINYYGGLYPNYKHRFCLEALIYSKHASYYLLSYDSRYLIPGVRTQAKLFFDNNPLYQFYGFNGAVHDYDKNLHLNRKDGIAYYSYDRKFLNGRIELEGNLSKHLDWTAGLSYWHYWIKELHWKGYNPDNTLFREYRKAGLIDDNEASGGRVAEFQAGIKYDTRDIEASPTRGIYADLSTVYAPDLFNTGYDYLKIAARFRQYLSLGTERIVLAYSLSYQGTFAGNPAFYSQPSLMYFKPSDGLGGATTLRGVLYNRVVGSDYLWGNFELRTRIMDFNFLNRRIFAVATPFFDAGIITQPFRFNRQAEAMFNADNTSVSSFDEYRSTLLERARELHMSWGISAQMVIDYNFIPTIVFGIPFDKRDGDYGLYMTLDYIF
ncbi:MAG: BamA/TamA family outer membrane protein [Bacteroidaceae bacterium]|nr:BamA/TamA family outer membrane protein [Bacteroidaceae bacterium]